MNIRDWLRSRYSLAIAVPMSLTISCTDSPTTVEPVATPDSPNIVVDDQGWLSFDPMKSKPGEGSINGPRIEFLHADMVETREKEVTVGVSIYPNDDTSALLVVDTLHVVAEKEIRLLGLRQKDLTTDVLEVLDRQCDGLLCDRLSINEAIKLAYGKGTYTFFISVSDENGNASTESFAIVRT